MAVSEWIRRGILTLGRWVGGPHSTMLTSTFYRQSTLDNCTLHEVEAHSTVSTSTSIANQPWTVVCIALCRGKSLSSTSLQRTHNPARQASAEGGITWVAYTAQSCSSRAVVRDMGWSRRARNENTLVARACPPTSKNTL